EEYENKLRSFLKLNRRTSLNFDLILLGLGEDGHTASLFPDSIAINEENHLISFVNDCSKDHDRITMTFPLINRADNIFFIIIGENKAEIVKKVLENKKNMFPANQVAPVNGSCLFLLDKSAASLLSELD
ncbi:6-phosphogluconolactonase, partial [bacterium]|nr:6-phosphogluconolactonase [bacterium]